MKRHIKSSYGGAFDIEDDQFFTREEIDEVAYAVEDALNEIVSNTKFKFTEVYIEPGNVLELTMYNTETEEYQTVTERIDFRKIKKPSDIMKYVAPLMRKVLDAFGISVDSIESATNTCGIPAKVDVDTELIESAYEPERPINPPDDSDRYYEHDDFTEVLQIPINGFEITLSDDGYVDFTDRNNCDWYDYDDLCIYTNYGEAYVDDYRFCDFVLSFVADEIPDEPGDYKVYGDLNLVCDVSGTYTEYFRDGDTEYHFDSDNIDINYMKSNIDNIRIEKQ